MKRLVMSVAGVLFAGAAGIIPATAQYEQRADRAVQPGGGGQDRIAREVRHELVMLPYYGVFDDLEYSVNGDTVTLMGRVTRPTLKSDAQPGLDRYALQAVPPIHIIVDNGHVTLVG